MLNVNRKKIDIGLDERSCHHTQLQQAILIKLRKLKKTGNLYKLSKGVYIELPIFSMIKPHNYLVMLNVEKPFYNIPEKYKYIDFCINETELDLNNNSSARDYRTLYIRSIIRGTMNRSLKERIRSVR